ncbi:MAG TPA: glycosyltransferase [Burkholderiales bacterium]
MKILCVLGEHNYGDPSRGQCYEYVNFLPALRNLGHQVIFFESFNRSSYRDFADLNRKFLEKVQAEKPDIILCVLLLGYEIWLETFELVRQCCNAVIINWSTDDSWKYEQLSKLVAPAFDIYATTYPEAIAKSQRGGHSNFVLTQWAASAASLAKPLPAGECRYPVSFVGSCYGNRRKWISALEQRGIDVACFGHGWNNGPVRSEEIPKIMRESVISLNFGDSGVVMRGLVPVRSRQIKARVFEAPGAGGFLMTESAENLDRFYRVGEEIVVFEGVSDLADKINYFLGHPEERDRIAMAGHVRTRNEHTYAVRFGHLLEIASRIKAARGERPCAIDFGKFDSVRKRYKTGLLLKLVKFVLLAPCMAAWGRNRGPRAARRFLFEISWRVVGKKTYSVSGWPGRLFYRES